MSALAPVDAPKFTSGSWTCFYKPKYDEWHVSLPMTGGSMKLALCPDGIQSENREADAHLIAAAPDLFHALNGLVGLVQLVRQRSDCPLEIKQALTDHYRLDEAFEALSKANPPSDSDAFSEVKGIARPENAAGVEPPLSEPHSLLTPSQAANSPAARSSPPSGTLSTAGV